MSRRHRQARGYIEIVCTNRGRHVPTVVGGFSVMTSRGVPMEPACVQWTGHGAVYRRRAVGDVRDRARFVCPRQECPHELELRDDTAVRLRAVLIRIAAAEGRTAEESPSPVDLSYAADLLRYASPR